MLTSSTQLQNRSFHVVERPATSAKFKKKMKNARAKRAKVLFFTIKYIFVTFLLSSSRGPLSSLFKVVTRMDTPKYGETLKFMYITYQPTLVVSPKVY